MKKGIQVLIALMLVLMVSGLFGCAQTGMVSRSLIVKLDGANEYETVEAFGKIIHATRGAVQVKPLSQQIVLNDPQQCSASWQVGISPDTDTFRFQTNMVKTADDVLYAQGRTTINGVPFRYSPSEVYLLKGLVPAATTSQSIRFVIDRDKARARSLSGD